MENEATAGEGAGREIARQDEMLELLFWFEGEGLGASATLPAMARFLVQDEATVGLTLNDLLGRGWVVEAAGDPAEYLLTEVGRVEAARRFADEFADVTSQGHGECNDPTCDCHDNPAGAAECHAAKAAGGHKH